jgi:hypothetical protein
MDRTSLFVPGLVLLLVASLLIAGCSTSGTTDQTTQPTVTTSAGARYTEGDIVRNPSSGAGTAWLVIGYDAASDTYERTMIYPNADGSWGYRTDTRTEKAPRSVMEKVYTDVVENKLPSSVPVVTPTTITPEETIRATIAATAVTPTAPLAPTITKIIPDSADAGTTVTVTDLVGSNLQNGANVTLRRAGSAEIKATGVRAYTPKSITCTLNIPASAAAGAWDLVVTNPDGQSATFTNIFSVHRSANALTTTSATSGGTIPISNIDPPIGHAGTNQIVITGSNFQKGITMKLQKSGKLDITARDTIWTSSTSIQCFIDIPVGTSGAWDVVVTNPDNSYGVNYGAFPIT